MKKFLILIFLSGLGGARNPDPKDSTTTTTTTTSTTAGLSSGEDTDTLAGHGFSSEEDTTTTTTTAGNGSSSGEDTTTTSGHGYWKIKRNKKSDASNYFYPLILEKAVLILEKKENNK